MVALAQHPPSARPEYAWLSRLRCAFITQSGDSRLFRSEDANHCCPPRAVPDGYRALVASLNLPFGSWFENAQRIARHLAAGHVPSGTGEPIAVWRAFPRAGPERSCEYSRVFTGLCIAAAIRVRQWGVCDDFEQPGFGHTFNEVYVEGRQKWLFLDPYRSLYAIDQYTQLPMGVTDLVDFSARNQSERIQFQYLDSPGPQDERPSNATVYLNPRNNFFLLSHNRVFECERFRQLSRMLPWPIRDALMLIRPLPFRYRLYTNPETRGLMQQRLRSLRRHLWRRCSQPAAEASETPTRLPGSA